MSFRSRGRQRLPVRGKRVFERRALGLVVLAVGLAVGRAAAQTAVPPPVNAPPHGVVRPAVSPAAAPPVSRSDDFVQLDFNDVELPVVIDTIARLTGTNFIYDDRVRGRVTIVSPTKI